MVIFHITVKGLRLLSCEDFMKNKQAKLMFRKHQLKNLVILRFRTHHKTDVSFLIYFFFLSVEQSKSVQNRDFSTSSDMLHNLLLKHFIEL